MKTQGNGRAKCLTVDELRRLFAAFKCERDRALFGVCLYTACRISEALALLTSDLREDTIVFRKSTTKGKLQTRTMTIPPGLQRILVSYKPPKAGPLFPGRRGQREFLNRNTADRILREACDRAGIVGASTHSFRRTALTQMANAGVPLSHLQRISGHHDLGTLQRYLEVSDDQVRAAQSVIGF